MLQKHLANFHGFIGKPPVKVLGPQLGSSSGGSPEVDASEPQGVLAVAVAKCLAPIILHHKQEDSPRTPVSGADFWSFTAMCLRAWVDRGLLPAAWSSWGFMAFILINCLPGILGQEPCMRPESPMTQLLRKALPAGSLPAPVSRDWKAFHESVGRSRQLNDIQSMEKDRVTLLLLARSVTSVGGKTVAIVCCSGMSCWADGPPTSTCLAVASHIGGRLTTECT